MATNPFKIGGQSTPATLGVPDSIIAPAAQPIATAAVVEPAKKVDTTAPTVKAATVTAPQSGSTISGLVINNDGSTNYQASLDAIKAKALELQKKAGALAGQNDTAATANPGSPSKVVSSSAPVVAEENQIGQDVNDLNATNDATTLASQTYLDNLAAESAALEARRANEEAGINASFDQKSRQLGEAQKSEKGSFTATLARIGGYLGDSASASGAIINLNQQHTYQQQDLESKRQSALSEARNAINDKQFAIARLKASEAKDYAKEIADNKQQFFDNKIKILQEQRQQDESYRTKVKDDLEMLGKVALSDEALTLDQAKADEIDQYYGVPGFTKQYLDTIQMAAKVKSQKENLETQKSMLDLLQNIPAGQKVSFPDGTEYTGMGKAGDVSTFLQVDSSGVGRLITYNKLTGDKSITSMGVVGKSSGGGSGGKSIAKTDPVVIDNAVARMQTVLETSKKDGQYDPDTYIAERNKVKESDNPQLIQYMDKLFLNKSNEYFSDAAINRLRAKGIYYGDTSLPNDTEPTVDENGDIIEGE